MDFWRSLGLKVFCIMTWQAARNVGGQVQRRESEMQGLRKIHMLSAAQQKEGKVVDWPGIRKAVSRSKPPYVDALDEMIAFVATRSGGVEGTHLQHLHGFYRMLVNPSVRCALPAAVYSALADFPYHFVAMAMWKLAYTCPAEHLRKGVCMWLSATEVASLAKAAKNDTVDGQSCRARLEHAEQTLAEARAKLDPALVGDAKFENKLTLLFAKLDINMARYILKKQDTSVAVFASARDVEISFCKEFQDRWKTCYMLREVERWCGIE